MLSKFHFNKYKSVYISLLILDNIYKYKLFSIKHFTKYILGTLRKSFFSKFV